MRLCEAVQRKLEELTTCLLISLYFLPLVPHSMLSSQLYPYAFCELHALYLSHRV